MDPEKQFNLMGDGPYPATRASSVTRFAFSFSDGAAMSSSKRASN
jgi:hypothetical protein